MSRSTLDLIDQIGHIRVRPFLAPILDAERVVVTTVQEGVQFNYHLVQEPGWWVLHCDQVEVRHVKGGEKVYHCGGGIVYHRHDEKGLNWEPGGIRSGAGVRSSGVSQESTGSSDTWEAAFCRLCLRR